MKFVDYILSDKSLARGFILESIKRFLTLVQTTHTHTHVHKNTCYLRENHAQVAIGQSFFTPIINFVFFLLK